MADPMFTQFIPPEMRTIAERSVQQAQKAFEDMMSATQRAVSSFEGHANAAQTNAREVQRKVVNFSERNVAAALQFAQRLLTAKTPEDVFKLHADYVKTQLEALTEQARDLGQHVTNSGRSGQ